MTCAFGLGDTQFEIDLNEAPLEELENALAKFIQFARPVSGGLSARKRRQGAPTSNQACGIDRAACAMIAASRASVCASPGCRSAIRRIAKPRQVPDFDAFIAGDHERQRPDRGRLIHDEQHPEPSG